MRPLYTSVRMLEASRKAPLCATLRHVFFDRFGWSHSLQVQWASTNGNRARRSSAMANASGACHQKRHDKSMALFTMYFRAFFAALGGMSGFPRDDESGLARNIVAFQTGSRTLYGEMPSSLGRAGRGTGLDHGEGGGSPGGPRDRRAGAVALSSLFLGVSVPPGSVCSSHRTKIPAARKMRRFFVFRPIPSHSVPFTSTYLKRARRGETRQGTLDHESYESHE